ncbi:putative DNA methyltransferase protein [Rhizobium phage RHph_I3_18]|nr:putative DNA methyltransferase protein [Rhizobium phage RHph_I3_18]
MGKRSTFERRKNDAYQTPPSAVLPLIPFLRGVKTFAEPCCGEGKLMHALEDVGLECVFWGDIDTGQDALTDTTIIEHRFDAIITNPPWTRELLHPMITRFQSIAPTWLLFDADWVHTRQAVQFLDQCSHIVSVGRVKWIEDSPFTGKDNAAWHRFHAQHTGGPRFYAREAVAA